MFPINIRTLADSFVSNTAWAIYPIPTVHDVGPGSDISAATSGSTAYSLCGTTALAGVYFPTSGYWSTPTPTVASQATVTPPPIKTNSDSADNTGTTEGGHKFKRTDSLTGLVARETSVATSSIPVGPGRRQLVGV